MQISVTDAKSRLTKLIRHAETSNEVILTRHGQPAGQIVPITPTQDLKSRLAIIEALRNAARENALPRPGSEEFQAFLCDEKGLLR